MLSCVLSLSKDRAEPVSKHAEASAGMVGVLSNAPGSLRLCTAR